MSLTYTLSSEGSSDQMLLPLLDWVLRQCSRELFNGQWANPDAFDNPAKDAATRIQQSLRYYESDLLFMHRDADGTPLAQRTKEIEDAIAAAHLGHPAVCVVPVKMTEAWFLFDETAIRYAADNPDGTVPLGLPTHAEAQRRADPKALLREAILTASEASGRQRRGIERGISLRKHIVASRIEDYSPLRAHQAFQQLEHSVRRIVQARRWG